MPIDGIGNPCLMTALYPKRLGQPARTIIFFIDFAYGGKDHNAVFTSLCSRRSSAGPLSARYNGRFYTADIIHESHSDSRDTVSTEQLAGGLRGHRHAAVVDPGGEIERIIRERWNVRE